MKQLPLSSICIDARTQQRVAMDPAAIEEYAAAYADGTDLPPVIAFFDGDKNILVDGFHRYQAAVLAGRKKIEVDVRTGTWRDAVLFSVSANRKHGLRPTNADKRKAVTVLLADAEWSAWSDREIARQCGVSHTFVAQVREALVNGSNSAPGGNVASQPPTAPSNKAAAAPAEGGNVATEAPTTTVATAPDTSAQQPGPATVTRAQPGNVATSDPAVTTAVDELGDALGDFDPLKELEAVQLELEGMRRDLTAATADDKAAEIVKWRRIAEQAQRRQNELMEQVNQREQELTWMTRALRQIGKAVGEADPKKVLKAVENLAAQLQP